MPNRKHHLALALTLAVAAPIQLNAEDWSQWLGGPNRLNKSAYQEEIPPLSAIDYQLAWRADLGLGYSSMIVDQQQVIAAYAGDKSNMVALLNAENGKIVWDVPLGAKATEGPLATPAVGDGCIFAISASGELVALHRKDGAPIWNHDLVKEFGTKPGFIASSPLLVRDRLIVLAGGQNGNAVIALSAADGKVIWKSQSDAIDCGSPTLVTLDGVEQVIAVAETRVFSVQLSDGKLLWDLDATVDKWSTPLPLGNDRVFLPMRNQHMVVECKRNGDDWNVRKVWANDQLNGSGSSFVHTNDLLIGSTDTGLVCLNAKTGELQWQTEKPEGAVTMVGGHVAFIERETGAVTLHEATKHHTLDELKVEPRLGADGWTPVSTTGHDLYVRSGPTFARFNRVAAGTTQRNANESGRARTTPPSTPDTLYSFAARIRPGQVVLFGEFHGTNQAPAFVANVAEAVLQIATPVRIGLEIPITIKPALDAYLQSSGTPDDVAHLTKHPFWRIGDGRSSVAMLELINHVRRLKEIELPIDVYLFDVANAASQSRDEGMATNILADVAKHPDAAHLILTGNLHARTNSPRYMGWHILQDHKDTLAFNIAHSGGTAWISTENGIGEQPLSGRDRGSDQFVEWKQDWNGHAYHGEYYVGSITASLPAVELAAKVSD